LARSASTSGVQARALFPSWPLPPAALRQHAQPLPPHLRAVAELTNEPPGVSRREVGGSTRERSKAPSPTFSMKFRMSISCTARIDAVSCLFSLTASTKYLLATNIPHAPSSLDLPPSGSEEAALTSCATVGSPAPARSATRLCVHSHWRSPRMPWRSQVAAAYR